MGTGFKNKCCQNSPINRVAAFSGGKSKGLWWFYGFGIRVIGNLTGEISLTLQHLSMLRVT
jgi:hypothetical protein